MLDGLSRHFFVSVCVYMYVYIYVQNMLIFLGSDVPTTTQWWKHMLYTHPFFFAQASFASYVCCCTDFND